MSQRKRRLGTDPSSAHPSEDSPAAKRATEAGEAGESQPAAQQSADERHSPESTAHSHEHSPRPDQHQLPADYAQSGAQAHEQHEQDQNEHPADQASAHEPQPAQHNQPQQSPQQPGDSQLQGSSYQHHTERNQPDSEPLQQQQQQQQEQQQQQPPVQDMEEQAPPPPAPYYPPMGYDYGAGQRGGPDASAGQAGTAGDHSTGEHPPPATAAGHSVDEADDTRGLVDNQMIPPSMPISAEGPAGAPPPHHLGMDGMSGAESHVMVREAELPRTAEGWRSYLRVGDPDETKGPRNKIHLQQDDQWPLEWLSVGKSQTARFEAEFNMTPEAVQELHRARRRFQNREAARRSRNKRQDRKYSNGGSAVPSASPLHQRIAGLERQFGAVQATTEEIDPVVDLHHRITVLEAIIHHQLAHVTEGLMAPCLPQRIEMNGVSLIYLTPEQVAAEQPPMHTAHHELGAAHSDLDQPHMASHAHHPLDTEHDQGSHHSHHYHHSTPGLHAIDSGHQPEQQQHSQQQSHHPSMPQESQHQQHHHQLQDQRQQQQQQQQQQHQQQQHQQQHEGTLGAKAQAADYQQAPGQEQQQLAAGSEAQAADEVRPGPTGSMVPDASALSEGERRAGSAAEPAPASKTSQAQPSTALKIFSRPAALPLSLATSKPVPAVGLTAAAGSTSAQSANGFVEARPSSASSQQTSQPRTVSAADGAVALQPVAGLRQAREAVEHHRVRRSETRSGRDSQAASNGSAQTAKESTASPSSRSASATAAATSPAKKPSGSASKKAEEASIKAEEATATASPSSRGGRRRPK